MCLVLVHLEMEEGIKLKNKDLWISLQTSYLSTWGGNDTGLKSSWVRYKIEHGEKVDKMHENAFSSWLQTLTFHLSAHDPQTDFLTHISPCNHITAAHFHPDSSPGSTSK